MSTIKKIILGSLAMSLILFTVGYGKFAPSTSQVQATVITETPSQTVVPKPANAKAVSLTISAASSLKDAMEEIKTAYAKEHSNITLILNFGASGSLQQQIEQGAPVDVFISAAAKQMNALKDKDLLVNDTQKNLIGNRIVLIIPKASTAVSAFKDLSSDKVKKIALGEPKSVPAGQYSMEALISLKLMDSLKSKVVYAKDAKEVLAWVETGNADAGLVYETDAKSSEKIKIVAVAPEGSHETVIYPAAVLKDSKNMDASSEFINYLYSHKSKPIFEKYGFVFIGN